MKEEEKQRICKMCGKKCEPERWVHGLCHKHDQSYRNAKKRILNHIKRLETMRKLIELVEGKPNYELSTNTTNYVTPKEIIDSVRIQSILPLLTKEK